MLVVTQSEISSSLYERRRYRCRGSRWRRPCRAAARCRSPSAGMVDGVAPINLAASAHSGEGPKPLALEVGDGLRRLAPAHVLVLGQDGRTCRCTAFHFASASCAAGWAYTASCTLRITEKSARGRNGRSSTLSGLFLPGWYEAHMIADSNAPTRDPVEVLLVLRELIAIEELDGELAAGAFGDLGRYVLHALGEGPTLAPKRHLPAAPRGHRPSGRRRERSSR